jgi:hypothetical protein
MRKASSSASKSGSVPRSKSCSAAAPKSRPRALWAQIVLIEDAGAAIEMRYLMVGSETAGAVRGAVDISSAVATNTADNSI